MRNTTSQLEKWTGRFGREYTDRNTLSPEELDNLYERNYGISRTELNRLFLRGISRSSRILEVGSNMGNQLLCLQKMGFRDLYGVEPQAHAVELSKKATKGINIVKGDAFNIPFKDGFFDLVFTSGVLIHISPRDIKKAMREIYRCTGRYIWGFEYFAKRHIEILYRGRRDLLWKADFPRIYTGIFRDLGTIKRRKVKYIDSDNTDEMFLLRKNG
jgi:pseudaminic acid biosynthesis-associated methylase